MPEVLTGTERSEIACPKDSPAGVAPPGPANAQRFAHRPGGCLQAHPAPFRALATGGARAFRHRPAGRNDPRSVARRLLPRLRHRTGHGVLRHLKRPAAPKCASRTPCSAAPSPPAAAFFRPAQKPVFDFRAHFCHSAPMETHAFGFRLRANAPEDQKRFPISQSLKISDASPACRFHKHVALPVLHHPFSGRRPGCPSRAVRGMVRSLRSQGVAAEIATTDMTAPAFVSTPLTAHSRTLRVFLWFSSPNQPRRGVNFFTAPR